MTVVFYIPPSLSKRDTCRQFQICSCAFVFFSSFAWWEASLSFLLCMYTIWRRYKVDGDYIPMGKWKVVRSTGIFQKTISWISCSRASENVKSWMAFLLKKTKRFNKMLKESTFIKLYFGLPWIFSNEIYKKKMPYRYVRSWRREFDCQFRTVWCCESRKRFHRYSRVDLLT